MIKQACILIGLLLLCSACVSRTITASDDLTGNGKQVVSSKKLIWFWQDDYSK